MPNFTSVLQPSGWSLIFVQTDGNHLTGRSLCPKERLNGSPNVYRKIVPITGPVVAQREGRGIALLFHDRGTRRG